MGQAIPYIIMAAAAGAQQYNTTRTANRQDAQAAAGIRQQGVRQQEADNRVHEQVAAMEGSTAADERAQRLDEYLTGLRRNRPSIESGLTPNVGSAAFRGDSARAAGDVQDYATRAAGLLSRIDAPAMQRQGEAFDYGRLATDIGLIGRQSAGDQFISDLRLRAIRRNPWIDAASQVAGAYGGSLAMSGAGTGAASAQYTPAQYGGSAVYSSARTAPGIYGVA
ncbi:hypothetical protein ABE488_00695 [Luteimonas sp. TWI662]|uniref:hypothetical protein n=1 Tax=Luteimonas sp. TWI662 TaxID=3136789 RepID=UPI00320A608C